MSTLFPILFAVLSMIAGIAVVGGIIYFIISFSKKKKTEKFSISANLLLKIYLYLMAIATLAIAVIGGTMLLKSASSYAFGIPFAYDTYAVNQYTKEDIAANPSIEDCYDAKKVTINNQEVCFNNEQVKKDLINGAIIFVSMTILFAVHMVGIKMVEKKDYTQWLKKTYLFLSLIVYSLIGIVTIPVSIYQLSTHLLYRVNDITKYEAPATALSLLVLVLPLWIYYLVKTIKLQNK